MRKGALSIRKLANDKLPDADTAYKFISLNGGFSSICFVLWVADQEPIEELTASTLRIGEKQMLELIHINKTGKLQKARFFVPSMQEKLDTLKSEKYNYAQRNAEYARKKAERPLPRVFFHSRNRDVPTNTRKHCCNRKQVDIRREGKVACRT